MGLVSELRRRNVFRMAVLYAVAAWLIMQVADVLIDLAKLPDWIGTTTLWLLAVGFPISLVFSWFYELTPEGISLERDVDATESITHVTGRRLDFLVISLLCAAVILFAYDKWWEVGPSEKSIAVLPFVNRSAVAEDVYFADGIQDDILTQLSKLSVLDKVISRGSTERYRGTDKSMQQIGEELGVASILEGGVQRVGDRVRINMQLIDASRDKHIWAETYDKELTAENLFAIQSEISREVVLELQSTLTAEDDEQLNRLPTDNLDAYKEFVLGRQEMAKRTADSLEAAQSHFERAIEMDREYALAYIGLADTIALSASYTKVRSADTFDSRRAAIEKALQLDPRSGEAYAALGLLRASEGTLDEAESHFQKAIELSPNYATAYLWYANLLRRDYARREEALINIRKALSLDPSAHVLISNLSRELRILGRVEEAKLVLLDGVRKNPEYHGFYNQMSWLLRKQGHIAEALAWLNEAARLNPSNFSYRVNECELLVNLDDPAGAELCADQLRQDFPKKPKAFIVQVESAIHFLRGDPQGAEDYVESAATDTSDGTLMMVRGSVHLWNRNWPKGRQCYEAAAPQFYTDEEIVVDPRELDLAIAVAGSLREGDGWSARAHYIAGQSLATMESMHRDRGIGYRYLDVPAHVIRGDREKAISALRDAVDSGWRLHWWGLRTPIYDVDWLGPEWTSLIAELEADIAVQRDWYKEHKDDALY